MGAEDRKGRRKASNGPSVGGQEHNQSPGKRWEKKGTKGCAKKTILGSDTLKKDESRRGFGGNSDEVAENADKEENSNTNRKEDRRELSVGQEGLKTAA